MRDVKQEKIEKPAIYLRANFFIKAKGRLCKSKPPTYVSRSSNFSRGLWTIGGWPAYWRRLSL